MSGRDRLMNIILDRSLELRRVVLASGRSSDYYIDCKLTTLNAEGARLVASTFLDWMLAGEARAVGGPVIGADPILGAMAALSAERSDPVHAFMVRKEAKKHGKQRLIEGVLEPGEAVILLDDVVTTGGSLLKAADAVRELGCPVECVYTIVDRQEGARENFAEKGLELRAIFQRDELLKKKRAAKGAG